MQGEKRLYGPKVKLDMSKTYDRVEWRKLGFCGNGLILSCNALTLSHILS